MGGLKRYPVAISVGPRFRGLVEVDLDRGYGVLHSRIVRFADVRRFIRLYEPALVWWMGGEDEMGDGPYEYGDPAAFDRDESASQGELEGNSPRTASTV